MPFESLSSRFEIKLSDFPAEWLPLTFLYDPDLPLFPILYFHALDPDLSEGQRPSYRDRVFGFIQFVNLAPDGAVAGLILNKDLERSENLKYKPIVERLVRERLGLGAPLKLPDIQGRLKPPLSDANQVIVELWHQIIASAFGNMLPFGNNWDGVFGLIRFVASWNSEGGRKGELIQTHYFVSAFGERIATGSTVNADFYLIPTFEELQDLSNPLNIFPRFSELTDAAENFVHEYCDEIAIDGLKFSAFRMNKADVGSKLKTESVLKLINKETGSNRRALFENYNAYNRGPQRSIIGLLMLDDLRKQRWNPTSLTPAVNAKMYKALGGSYQTPKVIQLYAQQCFGVSTVLPIDIWVETFLRWPLGFALTNSNYQTLFDSSDVLAKFERLIWVAAQGRKVHSSVCAEILWCIRYGGSDKRMRGANPLSCKICLPQIRAVCPAYSSIKDREVVFNVAPSTNQFSVETSLSDSSPNQQFTVVTGPSVYDEYSARDRPQSFRPFPQSHGISGPFTVQDFINVY